MIQWLIWANALFYWKTYGCHSFHPRLHYIHQNDYPGSSEISAWILSLWRSSRCVLSSDSSSLAYWNLRWTVLKPYILPQRHKRLILGIQIELFPLLSVQPKGLRWLRLIEYTLHLVSTSRPFWKYDCLLETSFSNQQSLAEIHSIAEILN